jgi:PAS domain S-box-containing protein
VLNLPRLRFPKCGVALWSVGLALLIGSVAPLIGDATPFILALTAVTLLAWYGGLAAGLFGGLFSALLIALLVPSPLQEMLVRLLVFLGVASFISGIIDAHKRAQEALRRSEARFRSIVEKGWDVITLIGADGRLVYASPAATRNWGYTPGELVGEGAFASVHPEDAARVNELFDRILREPGASATTEWRLRHKDGTWRWMEGTGVNLLSEPGVEAIVYHHRDITERRRLEEERAQLITVLQEADRRKDHFLAMLGHELRTPLGVIQTTLSLQQRRRSGPPAPAGFGDRIQRQVRRITRLIDDLQDLTRISRGIFQLHLEKLDLVCLARHTVEDQRRTLDENGLKLTTQWLQEPLWVEGDPDRLAQVIVNLLNNAAKFTDPGGEVTVHLARDATWTSLTIRDTGIGIEPQMLPHLFESFSQAERSLARSRGGLGLGLALVKALIEQHGGEVRVESAGPGKGAEFIVRLPLFLRSHQPAADQEEAQLSAPHRPTAAGGVGSGW